jgi:uncharacterized membrane protein HdeD (DUF308 family)
MNKILDLRFVIGVFFTVLGLILTAYSFSVDDSTSESINRWCGMVFAVFGIVMIVLSFSKDAHDELLEEEKE